MSEQYSATEDERQAELALGRLLLENGGNWDESEAVPNAAVEVEQSPAQGAMIATTDTIRHYFDCIGRYPLLGAEEEINLSKRRAAGDAAQALLATSPNGELSAADRARLRTVVADGAAAMDKLIEANLRLVIPIAKRYFRTSNAQLDNIDIIQNGNLGLIRAVEMFDPTRGYKFSTYAVWWIQQSINRGINAQSRTIRYPDHAVDKLGAIKRVEENFRQTTGTEPTAAETAAALDMPLEILLSFKNLPQADNSLDRPLNTGEPNETALSEMVGKDEPGYLASEHKLQLSELLRRAELNEREETIINERYGLVDGIPKTLEEIAADFNLSRERIRQLEGQTLRKLQAGVARRQG